ncbi:O-antigen ligase family protein [bacterium]|nr:O-antigen ligase family protein [bacterium]
MTPIEQPAVATRFDRIMSWIVPAIAALTPLVIVYGLQRPNVGQSYFFIIAVRAATAAQGIAWTLGWSAFPRRLRLPFWLIALNAATVLASLPVSNNVVFSIKQLLLPIAGVLFFMLVTVSPQRRAILTRVTLAMIAIGAVLALVGIGQHFGIKFLAYSEQVRKNVVTATIGHPNHLSSVLGPLVFFIVSLYYASRRRGLAVPALALVILCLCCIILARTRSIWLGLILGMTAMFIGGFFYMLRNRAAAPLVGKAGIGALVAICGVAVFAMLMPVLGHPIDLQERLGSKKEISSRFFYWNAAIDMGRERPILGRGYAMFDPQFWTYTLNHQKTAMGKYYNDVLPAISGTIPGHPHNEYLEVFCEQGLFGLVALLALMGFFLYYGWLCVMREPDPDRAMQQLAIWCALVLILTDAMLAFPWRLPVSLVMLTLTLAWLYEFIYSEPDPACSESCSCSCS